MLTIRLLLLLFRACRAQAAAPVVVVVSVPPQAWLVEQLAGDLVRVATMVPSGNSPATWDLIPSQRRDLDRATLYFRIGHPAFLLESRQIDPHLAVHPEIRVVDLFQPAVAAAHRSDPGAELDPHVWMSPALMRASLVPLTAGLAALLPEQVELLQSNQRRLEQAVDSLDLELRTKLAPLEQRTFMVQHPAWGWFASEYGLRQIALEHEGKDHSPAHLVELIELAREIRPRAVFVQRGFSQRAALTLAQETGAAVIELDPLAADWLTNMYHLAERLRTALMPLPVEQGRP